MVVSEEILDVSLVDLREVGLDHVFEEWECKSRFRAANLEGLGDTGEKEMTDVAKMLCRWYLVCQDDHDSGCFVGCRAPSDRCEPEKDSQCAGA